VTPGLVPIGPEAVGAGLPELATRYGPLSAQGRCVQENPVTGSASRVCLGFQDPPPTGRRSRLGEKSGKVGRSMRNSRYDSRVAAGLRRECAVWPWNVAMPLFDFMQWSATAVPWTVSSIRRFPQSIAFGLVVGILPAFSFGGIGGTHTHRGRSTRVTSRKPS